MRLRRRRCCAECGPIPGWVKQLQTHRKGTVWKWIAIGDSGAGKEIALDRANGKTLIPCPGSFRENAGAVQADVNRGCDLIGGVVEAIEFHQDLLGDAAFRPNRRKRTCHWPTFFDRAASYRRAVLAMDLASELGLGSVVITVRGPRDAVILELQSDAVAIVREFLAIDDLSADRDFIFKRSDLCRLPSLPETLGNNAGAVSTDVIRIR